MSNRGGDQLLSSPDVVVGCEPWLSKNPFSRRLHTTGVADLIPAMCCRACHGVSTQKRQFCCTIQIVHGPWQIWCRLKMRQVIVLWRGQDSNRVVWGTQSKADKMPTNNSTEFPTPCRQGSSWPQRQWTICVCLGKTIGLQHYGIFCLK